MQNITLDAMHKIDVGNNMMNDGFTSRMMTVIVDNAIGGRQQLVFEGHIYPCTAS